MNNDMQELIRRITTQIPTLLVYVAAIVLSLMFWNRHRRTAILAFSGSLLLVVTQLGFILFYMSLNRSGTRGGAMNYQLYAIVQNLLHAIGVGLIVAAVFADRSPETSPMRGFSVGSTR